MSLQNTHTVSFSHITQAFTHNNATRTLRNTRTPGIRTQVLTIKQDYDRARPLIAEAMKRMIQIGPDVPFILYVEAREYHFHRPLTHDAHELACPQLLLLAHGISLENQCSNAIFSLEQAHLASRQAIDIVTQGFRHRPTRRSNTHSHTKNLTRASHSNTGTVNIIMKVMSIR